MKKLISIIAIGLMPFMSINAQSGDSKNYLPEQGDMAFGINVKPVLKYVGNIFNGTTNNKLKNLRFSSNQSSFAIVLSHPG